MRRMVKRQSRMGNGRGSPRFPTQLLCSRNDPLELWQAGAAIGAGVQSLADVLDRCCPSRSNRVADGRETDAETGANDGTDLVKSVGRASRQQHPAFLIGKRLGLEQRLDHVPLRGRISGTDEQASLDAAIHKSGGAVD